MDEDDDLYAKLYGEEAPKREPAPPLQELQAEIRPSTTANLEPPAEKVTEPSKLTTATSNSGSQAEQQEVATFDDDEDDLEIRLDTIEPADADEGDELDIKLDSSKETGAANGLPTTPPGISSVHKYVRSGSLPEPTRKSSLPQPAEGTDGEQPSQPSQPAPASQPPPGLQPFRRPPSYPTYDPSDPGVLPSQATTKGQRVRLPGQTRVTPDEYKEFLCLGHGDIFHLDIDCVIDAPWYQPGADPADFFNYGLNPRTWKEYCETVRKFQTEFTMQRQIEVYDRDGSSRAGPSDLPPELAAAVAQRRAAEGAQRPAEQDRGSNVYGSYQDRNRNPSGQRALPFSQWQGREGPSGENSSKAMSDRGPPMPPFAALEWNKSRDSPSNQPDDSQWRSKRKKLDEG